MRRRMLLNRPAPYLRVFPEEVQWISTTTSTEYNIESNTDWLIQ